MSLPKSRYCQKNVPKKFPEPMLNLHSWVFPGEAVEVEQEVGAGLLCDAAGLLDRNHRVPPGDDDVFEDGSHTLRAEQGAFVDLNVRQSGPGEDVAHDGAQGADDDVEEEQPVLEGDRLVDEEVEGEDAESDLLPQGVHLEVVEDADGQEQEEHPAGLVVVRVHR